MGKTILIILCLIMSQAHVMAQQNAEAAYQKFMQVTSMFHGKDPYACNAIVEVKYKNGQSNALRDTSRLIYKNGSTYYKSKVVERVEASQGELIINHELKTASFDVSDSIRQVLEKESDMKPNKEMEALLDSNTDGRDLKAFNNYIVHHCNVTWNTREGMEEISFVPKDADNTPFVSMKIRFGSDAKVRYYEYANKEAYSTDLDGNARYRVVKTIYDNFTYDNVPNIPSKLADFLEWNGWTIKLKRYTNYKLSLL